MHRGRYTIRFVTGLVRLPAFKLQGVAHGGVLV
jgi:hypothetical protein